MNKINFPLVNASFIIFFIFIFYFLGIWNRKTVFFPFFSFFLFWNLEPLRFYVSIPQTGVMHSLWPRQSVITSYSLFHSKAPINYCTLLQRALHKSPYYLPRNCNKQGTQLIRHFSLLLLTFPSTWKFAD